MPAMAARSDADYAIENPEAQDRFAKVVSRRFVHDPKITDQPGSELPDMTGYEHIRWLAPLLIAQATDFREIAEG